MFEDKPVDVEKMANLLKFEITVNKHGNYYDFENSEEVVDDFLKMFVHDLNHLVWNLTSVRL